jgi:hypothetical protein
LQGQCIKVVPKQGQQSILVAGLVPSGITVTGLFPRRPACAEQQSDTFEHGHLETHNILVLAGEWGAELSDDVAIAGLIPRLDRHEGGLKITSKQNLTLISLLMPVAGIRQYRLNGLGEPVKAATQRRCKCSGGSRSQRAADGDVRA